VCVLLSVFDFGSLFY